MKDPGSDYSRRRLGNMGGCRVELRVMEVSKANDGENGGECGLRYHHEGCFACFGTGYMRRTAHFMVHLEIFGGWMVSP